RFQNRAQTARTGFSLHGLFRDGVQPIFAKVDFDILHLEQLAVLFRQRIFRLGKNTHQSLDIELLESGDDGEAPDEFRNQAVADQILRLDTGEDLADIAPLVLAFDFRAEADPAFFRAVANDL